MAKKKASKYENKITVKDTVQWSDLINLSLKTPPTKAEPPKKKVKKKGAK